MSEKRGKLHTAVIRMLQESNKPMHQISIESKLPYAWLDKLKHDKVNKPNVNRVEALYEHLSGKTLEV